jgi:hypothetical protein
MVPKLNNAYGCDRYGAIVLGVECLGASTTFLYGLNIIADPVHEPLLDDADNPGLTKVRPLIFPLLHTCFFQPPLLRASNWLVGL